ncbi:hypothetical protein F7725_027511, partial [Dissostichus mawsoni]
MRREEKGFNIARGRKRDSVFKMDKNELLAWEMEKKRWDCTALPKGWKMEEVTRKSGLSAGKSDGKPDLNTSLPVRQTASIFKQPVTKVTNHPNNKVKTDPQKAVDQPRQLFWEKKLGGLNAFDIAEELVKTMELPKGLQGVGPGCTDKTLLSAIASALHTSAAPITGQLSAAVEKNPGEELVYSVRKRLEEALMADMMAHVEEASNDDEALKDDGNGSEDMES